MEHTSLDSLSRREKQDELLSEERREVGNTKANTGAFSTWTFLAQVLMTRETFLSSFQLIKALRTPPPYLRRFSNFFQKNARSLFLIFFFFSFFKTKSGKLIWKWGGDRGIKLVHSQEGKFYIARHTAPLSSGSKFPWVFLSLSCFSS